MPHLARWQTFILDFFIEEFNFTIVHRFGRCKKSSNVDGLSSRGFRTESDEEDDDSFVSPIDCPVQTSECFGVKTENTDQVAPNVYAIKG